MKKVIILSFSLLAAGLFAGYLFLFSSAQVMGASVLSEEEVSSLLADKVCFSPETDAGLWLNGVEIPYETEEKRYYIPRNMEEDHWKGQICASADGMPASVIWEADEAFDNIKDAVAAGHVFACIIYNETGYQKVSVLFTGIPVMCIDGDMGETDSRVRVFDPVKSLQGNYQTEESRIYYNIRGNASKRFEKIGYRLELLQEDGEAGRKTSLLGMRIDNDWQLKAMYSDRSKLRDKLSIDLWNQIAERTETKADAGCRMEYLELIVNGSYQGLYGLVEPTDYKSLSLNKEKDLIYKAASDEWPDDRLLTRANSCSLSAVPESTSVRPVKNMRPVCGSLSAGSGTAGMRWSRRKIWKSCMTVSTGRISLHMTCIIMRLREWITGLKISFTAPWFMQTEPLPSAGFHGIRIIPGAMTLKKEKRRILRISAIIRSLPAGG